MFLRFVFAFGFGIVIDLSRSNDRRVFRDVAGVAVVFCVSVGVNGVGGTAEGVGVVDVKTGAGGVVSVAVVVDGTVVMLAAERSFVTR